MNEDINTQDNIDNVPEIEIPEVDDNKVIPRLHSYNIVTPNLQALIIAKDEDKAQEIFRAISETIEKLQGKVEIKTINYIK